MEESATVIVEAVKPLQVEERVLAVWTQYGPQVEGHCVATAVAGHHKGHLEITKNHK